MNSSSFSFTRGCTGIGHFLGTCTTGLASSQRVMWSVPGNWPIPSNWLGEALMRSSLELSAEVRSGLLLAHSVVGFLGGLGGSCLLVSLTTHFSYTISMSDEEGRPCMAGPGLSATYHLIWRCFELWWPSGVHSMAVSRAPNCEIFNPLYAASLVSQEWTLVGLPSVVIHLGNNLAEM